MRDAVDRIEALARSLGADQRVRALRGWAKKLYRGTPLYAPLRLIDTNAGQRARKTLHQRFVYLPWIAAHGDALMTLIDPERALLAPLPLFRRPHVLSRRHRISAYTRENPAPYRDFLLRTLAPLRDSIAGMAFTLDWAPPMRQAVYACRELGIPTVLIPHESVFARRDQYYVDRLTGADAPICDLALCWGELQRDIFLERGYDPARIRIVGSPKLDAALGYTPRLSREQFCRRYRLDPRRPIAVYALQPLDSQYEPEAARAAQTAAVLDLMRACKGRGAQLIVRFPPSGHDLLPPEAANQLAREASVAVDDRTPPRTEPHETLFHCHAIFSINSTMLIEGALMGRAAVSTTYLDFARLWDAAGLPHVSNAREVDAALAGALADTAKLAASGRDWVARALSAGSFDGGSAARIRAQLSDLRSGAASLPPRRHPCDHLFSDDFARSSDTAAFYREPSPAMEHVPAMLGFRRLLFAPSVELAQTADVFVSWGRAESRNKRRTMRFAEQLNRASLFVEDGFLRSVSIGLSGSPGLSIICDTKTAYYDATQPSRLEDRLNSDLALTPGQLARAERCMRLIRERRLSKYNHAPDTRTPHGAAPRVLLVDQRLGDDSVRFGMASEASFERMLAEAFAERPGHTILVKQHPDAISGAKAGFLDDERVARYAATGRLVLLREDVNPHALFDQVDEVFVVTSGMGMEALIAGLPVRCYGAPFYAGWGATSDAISIPRRQRRRSAAEIFHLAYLECSRYFDPRRGAPGEIEDVIEYLSSQRAESASGI